MIFLKIAFFAIIFRSVSNLWTYAEEKRTVSFESDVPETSEFAWLVATHFL